MEKKYMLLFLFCYGGYLTNAEPLVGHKIREAQENEFPFVVAIGNKESKVSGREEESYFCGGSLISRQHVLTARHCIEEEDIADLEVLVGSNDLRSGTRYDVRLAITYAEWAEDNCIEGDTDHDLAILQIAGCVSETIKLGYITKKNNKDLYGSTARTAGWGDANDTPNPRFLLTAELTIVSQEECNRIANALTRRMKIRVKERFLCTFNELYTLIGCGDSGGPLVINEREIIGVNKGVCPSEIRFPNVPLESKLNLHLGLADYRRFVIQIVKSRTSCDIL